MSRPGPAGRLAGFERDIHQLIDDYATTLFPDGNQPRHAGSLLSFAIFKQLWRARGFTYIHRAYPGCEHSPDYVQQLYTTALERLVWPSPVAAEGAPIYQLQCQQALSEQQPITAVLESPDQLLGYSVGDFESLLALMDVSVPTAAAAAPPPPPSTSGSHWDPTNPLQQLQQPSPDSRNPLLSSLRQIVAAGSLQSAPAATAAPAGLQNSDGHLMDNSSTQPPYSTMAAEAHSPTAQQPSSRAAAEWGSPGVVAGSPTGGSPARPHQHLHQPPAHLAAPQQQQQPDQPSVGTGAAVSPQSPPWSLSMVGGTGFTPMQLASPWAAGLSPLALPAGVCEMPTPYSALCLGGDGSDQPPVSPLRLAPAADPIGDAPGSMAGTHGSPMAPAQGASPTWPGRATSPAAAAAAVAAGRRAEGAQPLPDQQPPGPTAAGRLGASHPPPSAAQGVSRTPPPAAAAGIPSAVQPAGSIAGPASASMPTAELPAAVPVVDTLEAALALVPSPAAAAAAGAGGGDCGAGQGTATTWQVPLAVQAAVVFALYCLHATQVTRPLTHIYVPLHCLAPLAAAASAFAAAGAAEPLAVLQQLQASGSLVLGGGSRPRPSCFADWQPPAVLPASVLAAAQAAAADARNRAGAAAAAAAPAGQETGGGRKKRRHQLSPAVVREVLYQLKATLRGLANFNALQTLCEDYTSARAAIFQPLMPLLAAGGSSGGNEGPQGDPAAASGSLGAAAAGGAGSSGRQQAAGSQKKRSAQQAGGVDAKRTKAGSTTTRGGQGPSAAAADEEAEAAAPAAGAGPSVVAPLELFDGAFAATLQQFAADEAQRVIGALQPPRRGRGRKRAASDGDGEDDDAEGGGDAAAAARGSRTAGGAAGARRPDVGSYSTTVFGWRPPAAAGAAEAPQAATSGGAAATGGRQRGGPLHLRHLLDLTAAGVLEEEADAAGGVVQLARDNLGLGSAAQRALLQQADRQQQLLLAAETWFAAQDVMLQQQRDDELDSDMPEV